MSDSFCKCARGVRHRMIHCVLLSFWFCESALCFRCKIFRMHVSDNISYVHYVQMSINFLHDLTGEDLSSNEFCKFGKILVQHPFYHAEIICHTKPFIFPEHKNDLSALVSRKFSIVI